MAEVPKSIFNEKATKKLQSPDDLERYIRVTNPNVWVVLLACTVLLLGLLAWGIFGSITTNINTSGVVLGNQAVCYLTDEDAKRVSVGDTVNFEGTTMEVAAIGAIPLSREEARAELGNDYLASTLVGGDWVRRVDMSGDTSSFSQSVPVSVHITVDRVAPLSLILNGQE